MHLIFKFRLFFVISFVAVFVIFPHSTNAQDFWMPLNGPEGGEIGPICIGKNNEIIAGTTTRGIYHSTDNGNTWQTMNNGIEDARVLDIICIADSLYLTSVYPGGNYLYNPHTEQWQPISDHIAPIYAETMFMSPNGKLYTGNMNSSTYVSPDTGKTWIDCPDCPKSLRYYAINSKGEIFIVNGEGKVFQSIDYGDSWTLISDPKERITYAIAIDFNDNIYIGTSSKILRSRDNGQQWETVFNGHASVDLMETTTDGYIFAVTTVKEVFRSNDEGENWTDVSPDFPIKEIKSIKSGQNGHIFIASTLGLLHSADKGDTWLFKNSGIALTEIVALATGNNFIYAGLEGSLFRSSDKGLQWTSLKFGDLETNDLKRLKVNSKGILFAEIRGEGLYKSVDNGDSWEKLELLNDNIIYISIASNDYLFIILSHNQSRTEFRSYDDGNNWEPFAINCSPISSFDCKNNSLIAGTGIGVYQSFDYGDSWENISYELNERSIRFVCSDYIGNFYAISGNTVYKMVLESEKWTQIDTNPIAGTIHSLYLDANNVLYILTKENRIFRLKDESAAWESINSGLGSFNIQCMTIDSDGFLYAGTEGAGVYRSTLSATMLYIEKRIIFVDSIKIGETAVDTLLLKNTSDTNINISSITSSNESFKVESTSIQIQPGDSLYLQIRFTPQERGLHSGVLTIISNTNTSPDEIKVSGYGENAILKIIPDSLSFQILAGDTIQNHSVSLANVGEDILKITQINLSNPAFTVETDIYRISQGQSIHPVITFKPDSIGAFHGTCEIISNSQSSPDTLFLSGSGSVPKLKTNREKIELFSTVGTSITDSSLWLINSGSEILNIEEFEISDPHFKLKFDSYSIPPGDSVKAFFTFTPDCICEFSGICRIFSNSITSPDTIRLSGFGSIALVKMNKQEINLETDVGVSVQDSSLFIMNGGSGALTIDSVIISDTHFNLELSSQETASGESIKTVITFSPECAGEYSANIQIFSNSISSPDSIRLTGTARMVAGINSTPEQPAEFSLAQNFPNPFNNSTTIIFSLATESFVEIKIINLLGVVERKLNLGKKPQGIHRIEVTTNDLASGIYFYQLRAGDFLAQKKFILLK